MAECLGCLGDGVIDYRDDNAQLSEHLTEQEMVAVRLTAAWRQPIQQCDECGGTGQITQARHDELSRLAHEAIAHLLEEKT